MEITASKIRVVRDRWLSNY